jgi:hypothetical protein
LGFCRDPTSLESLSSGISRISSYVTSNLPKKRASLPSFLPPFDPQYNPQYMYGVPQAIPVTVSPQASESHISGTISRDVDPSLDGHTTPTYAAFDTLSVRRKDQKGQTRYATPFLGSAKRILSKLLTSFHCARVKCLMIGYQDGFQIWDVSNPDNIHELCSIRDEDQFANVTTIHSLVAPRKDRGVGKDSDPYEGQRPLIAIV